MEDKILKEISDFCETCESNENCPKDGCTLYRIEKLVTDEKQITICESCWKPIEGFSFKLDGITICSKCYEYHGGFDE